MSATITISNKLPEENLIFNQISSAVLVVHNLYNLIYVYNIIIHIVIS